MKQVLTTVLLAFLCIGMNAETIKPIIFDDPSFDIHSTQLSAEQRSFFDRYIRAMECMEAGDDVEQFFIVERAKSNESVGPLLGDINFNQISPYNLKCPYLNGGRAVTGCVATAMAQVMRYYQHPKQGTGTFQYSGGNDGAKTFVLDDNPFDWENILPTYDGVNYTSEEASAVATLMLACGASLSMNYDKDGSGASTDKVAKVLKDNFYYNKEVGYINTGNNDPLIASEYWGEDAVRPNLDKGWPLIFSGFPAIHETGHCFVIDGYKVENGVYYYHVNWGWGGHGNNWCLLSRLQEPDGKDYSGYDMQMVYNIHPRWGQGVDEIDADERVSATKELRNGQLVITRNNQQYSVQGQRIK